MPFAPKYACLRRACCFAALAALLVSQANAWAAPPGGDLAALERQVQAVYKRVTPALVRFGYDGPRKLQFGSGVIVTAEGHVVIVGPVQAVLKDKLLDLRLVDGRRVDAKALGWSGEFGLGMLKINEPGPWPHVDLCGEAKAGQYCVAIGYPRDPDLGPADHAPALRLGVVMKSDPGIWLTSSLRFNTAGHCLFDLEGRLLGPAPVTPFGQDSLYTSAALIKTHWNDLAAGKNLDRERLLAPADEPKPASETAAPSEKPDAKLMEKAIAASVRICEAGKPGSKPGFASGVIVTADGYVITCGHHKKLPGHKITLALADGRAAAGVVSGTNLITDVGLAKITDPGPWPHAELGHSTTASPGDRCTLIGYPVARPGPLPWVFETKIILPTQTLPKRDDWRYQIWTAEYPSEIAGASGGGVFDARGRVIGVLIGGAGREMQHARVELFRKNWDQLAAATPVEVLDSEPLAEIASGFNRIAQELPPFAVKVLSGGKQIALGTIVGSEGLVLTKASALAGTITCRLADGRAVAAQIHKRSDEHDLAVLKVEAADLSPAMFSEQADPVAGALIAALVPGQPPRAGVVSIASQPEPRPDGTRQTSASDGNPAPKFDASVFGTDIQLKPPFCGGPVIDTSGRVVGVLLECRTESGGFGHGHVVPASVARQVIADKQ